MGSTTMNYKQAVEALSGALRFGINPSLDGIRALTDALGRPQDSLVCIQVTGTNGKTSVTRLTAAILAQHGLSVGAYTSPHLESYTERIEVSGIHVSEEQFARGISAVLAAAEGLGPDAGPFTEFELLTAAALWLFRENDLDFAVLEVGMGGRWDATSVVDPSVAVITGVGMDHAERLGTTLREIAADKAQIIKAASSVVLGPGTAPVADAFLERTDSLGLHPRFVAQGMDSSPVPAELTARYRVTRRPEGIGAPMSVEVDAAHAIYSDLRLVAPSFQAGNVAVAVTAAEAALGRPLDHDATCRAIGGVRFPGRFEVLMARSERGSPVTVLLDGAHNPQAALTLAGAVMEAFGTSRPVALLGVLADKDATGIVAALSPVLGDVVCVAPSTPRALLGHELAAIVEALTLNKPVVADSVAKGLALAVEAAVASGAPGVLVAGSLYTAGEARSALTEVR
jgi:dihydrofolate synthase / folylpolyglutamate synthase